MFSLPPLPSWDAAHPMLVHLPIGILMVVPFFLALTLLLGWKLRTVGILTLLLMAIGTAGAWIAVLSGEAAADTAVAMVDAAEAMHEHEETAEFARTVFTVLTVIYAVIVVLLPAKKPGLRIMIPVQVLFLLAYLGGTVVLANAAHRGGLLVHHYGVHAPLPFDAPDDDAAPADVEPDPVVDDQPAEDEVPDASGDAPAGLPTTDG
jgi:uncharacterized membrane protein